MLRRPVEADVDAILAIHREPDACRHNPSDALERPEEAAALYQRWDAQWRRHGYGYWVVRRHGDSAPLGFCGIKPVELRGRDVVNLFYRLAPSAWGRGYAGEAATAVSAWASRHLRGVPLIARVRPGNVASQGVAVKAGLTRVDDLDDPGEDGPDWIYATRLPD